MAVKLWLCNDQNSLVVSLDDPSTTIDLGEVMTARFVTGKFSAAANAYSHIRSFLQQTFVANTMTGTVTPITNGTESSLDTQVFSADASTDGNSVQMLIPLYKGGVDHQVAVTVTAHTGAVEFGSAEMWVVPKRQKP